MTRYKWLIWQRNFHLQTFMRAQRALLRLAEKFKAEIKNQELEIERMKSKMYEADEAIAFLKTEKETAERRAAKIGALLE
jgi:hypothetical protein